MKNHHFISHHSPSHMGIGIFSKIVFPLVIFFAFAAQASAQNGRVGINTGLPLAALHVADSSVLFNGPANLPGTPGPPPVSGPGIRAMWYPSKGAFRTGRAVSTEWDRDSVGVFSFAAGENLKASGNHAVAMGFLNTASGNYSVALGSFNDAEGIQSVALGSLNHAIGSGSTTMGWNNIAFGNRSTALGFFNLAKGDQSLCAGIDNEAYGRSSAVFGSNTIGNAFGSFTIGQFNDTINASRLAWVATDPVFTIGNGFSVNTTSNALTVLKNGNVGLFTTTPTFRLHVANDNPNDGGYAEGIMIENTNTAVGEAAISFRNNSVPATRQWMVGINQSPPNLSFAYGSLFTTANTHMAIDSTGRIGMNTTSPQAPLHVVRNLPSGGSFITNPLAVFESNTNSYIQLSHESTDETGILSGNQVTTIRSAIVFAADSSIDLRAGGNGTDLKISTEGNVGIGIYTPTAKLHVNGTTKLGVNGTAITEIIKATVNVNVGSVGPNGGTVAQSFTVTNAAVNSAVSVSQDGSLAAGLVIASARVSAANTVEVRFVNTTGAAIDPAAMDYHFTVIR